MMQPTDFQPATLAADDFAQLDQQFPQQAARAELRNAIAAAAGDSDSVLGTTADTSQLLLYGAASLITKLHDPSAANPLSKLLETTAPFAELCNNFLAKVDSGEVKLPFKVKGLEAVVTEIEQRTTAVSEVLELNSNQAKTDQSETNQSETNQSETNGDLP